jgi:meso-butanediol dehydrogenase/(S,S)-butanediol dehydrogenase/diacetyl reductase
MIESRFGVLLGKIALVTGAGRGIGRAVSMQLASEGADIVVATLDASHGAAVADEIHAIAIQVDVASIASIRSMVRETRESLGRVDILVCNAGLIRPNPFGSVTEDDWDVSFAVNAKGLFFTMQEVAPLIPDGGAIVTVASVAGRGTATASPPYAASKAAVINVTQTTARALAPRRIRVNAVCPAAVATDFQFELDRSLGVEREGLLPGEFLRRAAEENPLGRIGTPEDIAEAVAFLAGPRAGWISGQTVNIDGGIVIF